jgi:O-antigen ligase
VALALVTISRASFVAAVVGSAAVMGLSVVVRPGAKKVAIAIALMIPIALGVAVVSDQLLARSTEDAETTGEGTFRGALEHQAQAMLSDEPLGIGWNNFCLETSPPDGGYVHIMDDFFFETRGYRLEHVDGEQSALIENLYWMILGETGYVAFVLFVMLLLLFLSHTARSLFYFRTNELGASPLAFSVMLPMLYLHSYVERILVDTPVLIIFLIFTAVSARLFTFKHPRQNIPGAKNPRRDRLRPRSPDRGKRLGLVLHGPRSRPRKSPQRW